MDVDAINRKFQKELNAGAGALVILGLLQRSGRAMYGYEIGKQLEMQAEGVLPMHQERCIRHSFVGKGRTFGEYCGAVGVGAATALLPYYRVGPAGRSRTGVSPGRGPSILWTLF